MKFTTTWTIRSGALPDAVGRFLAGQGQPAAGVTLLGRWIKADCSAGFTLYESTNAAALYESAAVWADLLELQMSAVVEDAESAPVLAKAFKK